MDFTFNRRSDVRVRDQLTAQLEMKILDGTIAPGLRLPSVRAMARRLKLHPNTVAASYRDLQLAGHVDVRRGSGVFARRRVVERLDDAQSLDDMLRVALAQARRRGFSDREVRAAVERWLAAAPADRVVVVDRFRPMAELVACELDAGLGVPAECCSIEEAAAEPGWLHGAVAVTLAWHMDEVQRLAPTTAVEMVPLEMSAQERELLLSLPDGSIVLIVSHAPTVLPYARKLVSSLRGDGLLVEAHALAERARWRRLLPAADLVIADALAAAELDRAGARRLRQLRLVSDSALARLAPALNFAARPGAAAAPSAGGAETGPSARSMAAATAGARATRRSSTAGR